MTGGERTRWKELSPLLDQALDLPAPQRDTWLAALSIDDDLKTLLRQALARSTRPHPLLDSQLSAAALLGSHTSPADSWIGRTLGGWRITGFLGQGGMAAVFAAERIGPPAQQGALKLMQRGLFTDAEREQFRREQEILARLEHPGVSRLIDAGLSDDGIPFLVMEPVSGQPIDHYVRAQRLDLRERMQLMAQACEIVAYAQRLLVVHRDLKPEHVLIVAADDSADVSIKILDFGIAKMVGEERATQTYARLGTPRYSAPEQVAGDLVSTATDVFSLGQIAEDLALDCVRTLPRDLAAVLAQATRQLPEHRYPSAAELAADLRRWLSQRPVLARRTGPLPRMLKFLRRQWIPSAALAAIMLSLLVGVVLARSEARRADRAAEQATAAQKQTESALARATTLNRFVVGLFQANVASVPRDEMPTTRQIVDEGVRQARMATSGPPEVRAEMLVTLSQILRARVDYVEARKLVDDALLLLEPIASDFPDLYADALLSRAAIDSTQKELVAARVFIDRADAWTAQHIPGSRRHIEARREVALNDYRRGDVATARQSFEAINSDLTDRPALADIRLKVATDLAIMYAMAGELNRAADAFATVLALKQDSDSIPTGSVISAMNNLASARSLIGQFDESNRLYDEAIELLATLDDSPLQVRAAVWRGKAENAQRIGHFDEALELMERSAESWRQSLSLASVDDDTFLPYYHGMILADAERHIEAIRQFELADARMAQGSRDGSSGRRTTAMMRARLLCEIGNAADGSALLLPMLDDESPEAARDDPDLREAAAGCALARGEVVAAKRWLDAGELVDHPEAVGLSAVLARRQLLRAAINLQLQDVGAATRDVAQAESALDAIEADRDHPLRRRIQQLSQRISAIR